MNSRGRFRCAVTRRPILVAPLVREVAGSRAGAIVVFLGVVRRNSGSRRVKALRYTAYEPMALLRMKRLLMKMRRRWRLTGAVLEHRLGRLPLGEIAVAVVVSSPHRPAAFAAARSGIDELKRTVPIWKSDVPAR